MIERMEPTGRWWLVDGREVDLNAESGTSPPNLRAAVLATRDAETPSEQDVAAYLEWALSANPDEATRVANEVLWNGSQRIYRRLTASVDQRRDSETRAS